MKSVVLWALAVVNVLLLATLAGRYVNPNSAMAARGGRRPDLMMIPGKIIGGNSDVVYLIDSANRRLGAIAMSGNGRLEGVAPINLDRAFEDAAAGGGDADDNGKGKGGRANRR